MSAPEIVLTDWERQELQRRVHSRTTSRRNRQRARVILLAAEGLSNRAISERIGLRPEHVGLWRRRFAEQSLAGLDDRPRPGRPLVYGPEARARVLDIVAEDPPDPPGYWTMTGLGRVLQQELGISKSQARRVLLEWGFGSGVWTSGNVQRRREPRRV